MRKNRSKTIIAISMIILDGRKIAQKIKNRLRQEIANKKLKLTLAAVLVGNDPASVLYVRMKEKACREIGISFRKIELPKTISSAKLLAKINKLNSDREVTGIIIQLPLPKHLDSNKIISAIDPRKDIDGLHPENLGKLLIGSPRVVPPTPAGIIALLKAYQINLSGKNVVLVGYGKLVGKPLAAMLAVAQKDATITICNDKTRYLSELTKKADILITATGVPYLIKAKMVKKGAVVIDAGTSLLRAKGKELRAKIVGDVDFEKVKSKCSYVTPPTGGVGPMTVAKLLENVVRIRK